MTRLLGCLALLAACAVAQTVEGSAVDSATGNGIAGVRVEFLQAGKTIYEATTEQYYALAVPGDGSITLNFRKLDEGLLKQAGSVTVSAGETSSADLRAISRPAN